MAAQRTASGVSLSDQEFRGILDAVTRRLHQAVVMGHPLAQAPVTPAGPGHVMLPPEDNQGWGQGWDGTMPANPEPRQILAGLGGS